MASLRSRFNKANVMIATVSRARKNGYRKMKIGLNNLAMDSEDI